MSEPTHGGTQAAGEGVSDEEMATQVAEQTSSDLKVEDLFEAEADHASTDQEAAKSDADEVAKNLG